MILDTAEAVLGLLALRELFTVIQKRESENSGRN
jgi:hypothetical protein